MRPSPEQSLTLHGPLPLEARIAPPARAGHATWYVLAHPHPELGGTLDNKVVAFLAGRLRDAGAATLRFNFRGVGRSAGRFDEGRGEQADLAAAVRYVTEAQGARHVVIVGYSFGAFVAAHLVPRLGEHDLADLAPPPLVLVAPPLALTPIEEALGGYDGDVQLAAGDADDLCPVDRLRELAAHLGPRAEAHVVERCDHLFGGALGRLWDALQPAFERFSGL